MAEDEMVGWPHQVNGHEFEQTSGDSEGQGSLAGCGPWCRKESDRTELMGESIFQKQFDWIQIILEFYCM